MMYVGVCTMSQSPCQVGQNVSFGRLRLRCRSQPTSQLTAYMCVRPESIMYVVGSSENYNELRRYSEVDL